MEFRLLGGLGWLRRGPFVVDLIASGFLWRQDVVRGALTVAGSSEVVEGGGAGDEDEDERQHGELGTGYAGLWCLRPRVV